MIPPYAQLKSVYIAEFGGSSVRAGRLDLSIDPPELQYITSPEGEPSGFLMPSTTEMLVGSSLPDAEADAFCSALDTLRHYRLTPFFDDAHDMKLLYLRTWLQRLRTLCPHIDSDGTDTVWLIACVPGWEQERYRTAYRNLFAEAGFVNPLITPESNGLFSCFSETACADTTTDCIHINLGGEYLNAIYTTPAQETYLSHGSYIGCDLIDHLILSANLLHHNRYTAQHHNPAALTDAVRNLFHSNRPFREYLLLQCGALKKRYFSAEALGLIDDRDISVQISLPKALTADSQFTLFVNVLMMEDILKHRAIIDVLGPAHYYLLPEAIQESIAQGTWADSLTDFLTCTANLCSGDIRPTVILHGGGCHMEFAENAVLDAFPDCTVLTAPSDSIVTDGLAAFAPPLLKMLTVRELFKKDFCFCETPYTFGFDPYEESVKAYNRFRSYISIEIAQKCITILFGSLQRWVDYQQDSSEILPSALRELDEYLSNYLPELYQKQLYAALEAFFDDYVKETLFPIYRTAVGTFKDFSPLRRHALTPSMEALLETDAALQFLAQMEEEIPQLDQDFTEFYCHYQEEFAALPNPVFKLFSSRNNSSAAFRLDFYNHIEQKKAETEEMLRNKLSSDSESSPFPLFHRIICDELKRQYLAMARLTPAGPFIFE